MVKTIIDKTRKAYGTHENGNVYFLGDTVEDSLKANMMVKDYEKELVKINPQLKIEFMVEYKNTKKRSGWKSIPGIPVELI